MNERLLNGIRPILIYLLNLDFDVLNCNLYFFYAGMHTFCLSSVARTGSHDVNACLAKGGNTSCGLTGCHFIHVA